MYSIYRNKMRQILEFTMNLCTKCRTSKWRRCNRPLRVCVQNAQLEKDKHARYHWVCVHNVQPENYPLHKYPYGYCVWFVQNENDIRQPKVCVQYVGKQCVKKENVTCIRVKWKIVCTIYSKIMMLTGVQKFYGTFRDP